MALNVGINVVEVDGRASPAIQAAPTSVAAFLGLTERGVPNQPVRSLRARPTKQPPPGRWLRHPSSRCSCANAPVRRLRAKTDSALLSAAVTYTLRPSGLIARLDGRASARAGAHGPVPRCATQPRRPGSWVSRPVAASRLKAATAWLP